MSQSSVLRSLTLPVYLPSLVYAAGSSALLPAQILLALSLGFTPAQIALIVTWVGVFGVAASAGAGYLVQAVGERRALAVTTTSAASALAAVWASSSAGWPASRWFLVAALMAANTADAVWSIARQGLVADLAPASHRGRAMNLYGASQRLGRVAGPVVAAIVLSVAGPGEVFPVAAGVALAAYGLIARHLPGRSAASSLPGAGLPAEETHIDARAWRALLVLGVGIAVLQAVRAAKESFIPLWAADGIGLPDATIALVMGVASAMELLLFWPSGLALDRIGRGPVVATALGLMSLPMVVMPWSAQTAWFVAAAMVVGLGDGVGAGIVKVIGIDLAPARQRAHYLGWWQSIASAGAVLAPAMGAVAIAVASLAAVLPVVGGLGLVAAGWMAYWTPRFITPPTKRPASR